MMLVIGFITITDYISKDLNMKTLNCRYKMKSLKMVLNVSSNTYNFT